MPAHLSDAPTGTTYSSAAQRERQRQGSGQGQQQEFPPARGRALAIGLTAVAILAILLYWPSTGIGFLLDDLLPPAFLWSAFHGNPAPFLDLMFFGGSVHADGLTCFRPGTSLTMLLDYCLWGGNGFGYHLTNILCFTANCVFVGLITSQLCQLYRLAHGTFAAVAAAALFACYPLHVESTAWIIGRVDVLCTMFYLASFYCYTRYFSAPSTGKLIGALVLFLASLSTKEMAVTLPVVVAVFALIAPDMGMKRRQLWLSVGSFWAVLCGFAALRTFMLGTVIGGYGGGFDKHTIRQAFRNFFDGATWWKVMCGITDEYPVASGWQYGAIAGTIVAAICGAVSMIRSKRLWSLFAFLTVWMLIALLPTFQILHIFPNLVGARLFFMSSAPLCMMVALSFACLTESTRDYRPAAIFALACLTCISVQWASILRINLAPWCQAGKMIAAAAETARDIARDTPQGQKVLFANLPADYKGAGLIARPEYLAYMLQPPASSQDLSGRIATCERPVPGPNAYVFPNQFQQKLAESHGAFIWSDENSRFERWSAPSGIDRFHAGWIISPSPEDQQSLLLKRQEQLIADANGTRILTTEKINPLKLRALRISFAEPIEKVGAIHLIWRAPGTQWWQCAVNPTMSGGHSITFVPSRLRTWTFAPTIEMLGLQGAPASHVVSVTSEDLEKFEPRVKVSARHIYFDAAKIKGAQSVRIYVAQPGQSFSDLASDAAPDPSIVAYSYEMPCLEGELTIPTSLLPAGSTRAVCAQAFNDEHQPIGILSEVLAVSR